MDREGRLLGEILSRKGRISHEKTAWKVARSDVRLVEIVPPLVHVEFERRLTCPQGNLPANFPVRVQFLLDLLVGCWESFVNKAYTANHAENIIALRIEHRGRTAHPT